MGKISNSSQCVIAPESRLHHSAYNQLAETNCVVTLHTSDLEQDNMAAEGIVNTLKAKLKKNDEEREMYETECRETKAKLETESKSREETESEVLNLQNKIKLLQGKIETKDNAAEEAERKSKDTSDHLLNSDEQRQNIENKYNITEDKMEVLQQQVLEAKKIAEESDQKCAEIVRKLIMTEHQKNRAEEKATRNDNKIVGLQAELSGLTKTVASLYGGAESRAETAERAVQKLQKEVDAKESEMMTENGKQKKMEEGMENLMQNIASI